jgi:hypothetical protein
MCRAFYFCMLSFVKYCGYTSLSVYSINMAPKFYRTQAPCVVNLETHMTLSHDLLIESKSVRSQALNGASDEQALKVLNKARSILLATWKGVGYATTEQVAAFYEVALTTIKETYRIDKQEFGGEVIMLAGQDLRDARQVICLPSKTSQALVWTAKAFLRVGLMLRDSEIAKKLRDQYEQVMALADASGMPRATFLREVLLTALGVQDA